MSRYSILILVLALALIPWSSYVWAQSGEQIYNLEEEHLIATVHIDTANLYAGPGADYAVVETVVRGTRLPVLAQSEGWYLVERPTADQAWIGSWLVSTARFLPPSGLVPADTALYLSVDTGPGMFNRLDELLGIVGSEMPGGIMDNFNRLLSLLFLSQDITIHDVRPWLGDEVAVVNLQCLSSAMVDYLTSDVMEDTPLPSVVILASIVDPPAAEAFMNRVLNSSTLAQAPHQTLAYNGYSYVLFNDPTPSQSNSSLPVIAMGIVDDYMVFAQGSASFERIVDVAKGALSLEELSGFREVYGDLATDSFMRAYVGPALFCPVHDPVLYDALLSETFASNAVDFSVFDTSDPEALQDQIIDILDSTFKGYGIGFRHDAGVLEVELVSGVDLNMLQVVTGIPRDALEQTISTTGIELFGFLTPQTLEVLTFGNLTETYDTLSTLSASTPGDTFETATGLNQDLLQWMDGSITMGFVNYPIFDPGGPTDAYFLMIVESPGVDSATNAFNALIASVGQQPQVVTSVSELMGEQITTIVIGGQPEQGSLQIARIDNYVVLATGGNMEQVLENGRCTDGGIFCPDWRQLAGLPPSNKDHTVPEEAPFIAALDLTGSGYQARIQAAAIVTPVQPGSDGPSHITIICTLCHSDETCQPAS